MVMEYMLQPESMLARKRDPSWSGVAYLAVHVAIPAVVCVFLGLLTPWQGFGVAALHFTVDGPFSRSMILLARVASIRKTMREPDHEKWPIQVQALEFALTAANEKAWYVTAHVLAIYAGMRLWA